MRATMGKLRTALTKPREGVVQDGGAGAPVLEDALNRDGRGGVRVKVGRQLGAKEDEGGVGNQVEEAALTS